jgi:hypothetical protein
VLLDLAGVTWTFTAAAVAAGCSALIAAAGWRRSSGGRPATAGGRRRSAGTPDGLAPGAAPQGGRARDGDA